MNIEGIKDTLLKIKRLMDDPSATQGERESAQEKFHLLMGKYGLSEDDIISGEKKPVQFSYKTKHEKKILLQVISMVINPEKHFRFWNLYRSRKIEVDVTPLEEAEIILYWSAYKKAFNDQLEDFVIAFIMSNDIFSKDGKKSTWDSLTEDEKKKIMRRQKMALMINKTKVPRGLLNGKG